MEKKWNILSFACEYACDVYKARSIFQVCNQLITFFSYFYYSYEIVKQIYVHLNSLSTKAVNHSFSTTAFVTPEDSNDPFWVSEQIACLM